MDEVRNEVRTLRDEVLGMRNDLAELKRLMIAAYGPTKTNGNGNGNTFPTTLNCSRSPFQHHYRMTDGSCACQHTPAWARG
jgi:hypothetical protein